MRSKAAQHRWRFYRAGGVDQVMLRDGKDLAHLPELDPKLWVALAMPTRGVHFDTRTLDDAESDKHINKAATTIAEADKTKPTDKSPEGPKIDVGRLCDPSDTGKYLGGHHSL